MVRFMRTDYLGFFFVKLEPSDSDDFPLDFFGSAGFLASDLPPAAGFFAVSLGLSLPLFDVDLSGLALDLPSPFDSDFPEAGFPDPPAEPFEPDEALMAPFDKGPFPSAWTLGLGRLGTLLASSSFALGFADPDPLLLLVPLLADFSAVFGESLSAPFSAGFAGLLEALFSEVFAGSFSAALAVAAWSFGEAAFTLTPDFPPAFLVAEAALSSAFSEAPATDFAALIPDPLEGLVPAAELLGLEPDPLVGVFSEVTGLGFDLSVTPSSLRIANGEVDFGWWNNSLAN
jgi:hypothetical protein